MKITYQYVFQAKCFAQHLHFCMVTPIFWMYPPIPKLVVLIFHPPKNGGEICTSKIWGVWAGRGGENANKRKQMRANVDKRKQTLTPPFIAVFLHPLCNPLILVFVVACGCPDCCVVISFLLHLLDDPLGSPRKIPEIGLPIVCLFSCPR